ncbi:1-acyl-sn-glycerol-3-phosphate acyltransferase [Rhodococcus antarcticus]|uniref:1-acyl-sn-glycerol-3-phosphate acyltransferase n=1 Tax=Rhodococcus antarcticus TaxID=2987751 RepID=A0ABY6P180_9NOCA|nr:lysophospholipid acyltransferase family protein [Rhodococcus antarcticus]UZJ25407.1 1-acyl-sn-glycerol-3-phosphate acyltransferase [Rhodococcus antarcticus]
MGQERRAGDGFYRVVVRAFTCLFALLGLRLDVRGLEHVPRTGAAVLAINHTSYLDFAVVGYAASRRRRLVRFLAKAATFDSPVSGPFMRAMGHVPVDRARGAAAYRRAARELDRGELVGIFPEATISRSWTLKPFKLGAATLTLDRGVPLLPVVVWGAHRVLTVDRRGSPRRGRPVTVHVGAPVQLRPGAGATELDAELRRRLDELLGQVQRAYPDAPRDAADRWWLPAHLGGTAPLPAVAAVLDRESVARADDASAARAVRARERSTRRHELVHRRVRARRWTP